jgi:hypothetical protein
VNDNQLITELVVYDNDSSYRYLYYYDNYGNKVLETKYNHQDSAWVRNSQIEWSYDGTNCISQIERIWKENNWQLSYVINYSYVNNQLNTESQNEYKDGVTVPSRKITYQYNTSASKTKSEFNWQNNSWTLSQEDKFSYLSNGKTDSMTTSVYQSGSILNQYISTFTYNSDETLESQLIKQKENTSDWVNFEFVNWYYKPGTTQILSQRNKKWLTETSKWENTQKIDYQYTADNKLLTETYQRWNVMFWENDSQYDYVYDTGGLLVKKVLSLPIYNQWRSVINIVYSDFANNKPNLMESQYDYWGGNTGELTNSYIPFLFNDETAVLKAKRLEINYLPIYDLGIKNIEYKNSLHSIPVYPNPSAGIFYVNTQNYVIQSWTLLDLSGRVLKKQLQSLNSGVIDITDLPNGIYILRVSTSDALLTQKLVKE